MSIFRLLTYLFAVGLLSACAGPSANPGSATTASTASREEFVPSSYRLGVGDVVKVDVFREADLSLEAVIESSGNINYPLIGYVKAVGLTARELETRLVERLGAGYLKNPEVRAFVVRYRPVFVSGAVRNTGAFPFSEGLTVERALALASGMTPLGSVRRMFVLREGEAAVTRQRVQLDSPLYPGDTLFVEEGVF